MSKNINGTDRIVDFLRQNMLTRFCVQWPAFSKLVERFGEEEILMTYAEKLTGRGYKALQIKSAIDKATQNDLYYPKPYVFANLVKTPNFNEQHQTSRVLSANEQHNVGKILERLKEDVKKRRSGKRQNRQLTFNSREELVAYIDSEAEEILGRPLKK